MRKPAIAFICFILLLSSCSKETVFSHYLKGNWSIARMDVRETTDTINSNYSLFNAGTYVFNKNNEGSVTTSADTSKKTLDFKWSTISNTKVLLTFENQSIEEWIVLNNKHENQTWECSTSDTISSGGTVVINTFYRKMYLKKFD